MLDISDLHATYLRGGEETPVLHGVTFGVPDGSAVALVGESGSGKSTVVLSIMRLLRKPIGSIDSGRIDLAGEDLLAVGERRMKTVLHEDIGYVPQDPSTALDPLFTVGRQIFETMPDSMSRAERTRVAAELLDSLGVPDPVQRLKSFPHQLSGGMQQRVAIAVALARDPKFIIADEPTTALDVTTQLGILRLLDRLRRERHLSLLFVTHDLSVAQLLCQHVVVLYAGRIMEQGPTKQVMAEPRHPYTRALVDALPSLSDKRARLKAIPGQPPSPGAPEPGCAFAPRCPLADDRCRSERPELAELEGGVKAACWKPHSEVVR
jgi:oligopeptide/dipeptide ABC transporter ATP-binding protein